MARRVRLIVVVVAASAVVALVALRARAPAVAVVQPVIGPAVEAVYATGTVEPSVLVPVAPRSAARLTELAADEGQAVRKDQVLARLEDADLARAVEQADAEAELARTVHERYVALAAREGVSQEALERSAAELLAARAKAEAARAMLSYLQLRAPADGVVLRRDGEVGQLIPTGQAVFWLSSTSPLRISAEVDEEDIPQVQPGQRVLVSADAFPGRAFAASVLAITPKGDPIARSFRVRIGLGEATPLLVGMSAEANIVVHEQPDAVLVPASAVRGGAVWTVRDGRAERRAVTVGARTKDAAEIRAGLAADEAVMRDPPADLDEGRRVRTAPTAWKLP